MSNQSCFFLSYFSINVNLAALFSKIIDIILSMKGISILPIIILQEIFYKIHKKLLSSLYRNLLQILLKAKSLIIKYFLQSIRTKNFIVENDFHLYLFSLKFIKTQIYY